MFQILQKQPFLITDYMLQQKLFKHLKKQVETREMVFKEKWYSSKYVPKSYSVLTCILGKHQWWIKTWLQDFQLNICLAFCESLFNLW